MPQAGLKFCSAPNCRTLIQGHLWRCQQHRAERHEEYDRRRPGASDRGYDRRWQKIRAQKLSRNPFCEMLTHCRFPELATEVDHITPVEVAPELRLVWGNLQSACHACHVAKTNQDKVKYARR
jgi:5-methylcytosine-specific restriction protein A